MASSSSVSNCRSRIITRPAIQRIVTRATIQRIITGLPLQNVDRSIADNRVITG